METSTTQAYGARIKAAVTSWPEVETVPHRFGGLEFRVRHHEIGHVHGNRLADLPFPKRVRDELVAQGRAVAHHVLPESGWVSLYLERPEDVERAIELFRLNYERLTKNDPRSHAKE